MNLYFDRFVRGVSCCSSSQIITNCFLFSLSFSVRSVMHKHLEKMGEVTFDKIFNQKLGESCFLISLMCSETRQGPYVSHFRWIC